MTRQTGSALAWPPDSRQLDLPLPCSPRWVVADAFGAARTLAMADGEPGTLALGEDDAVLELAVILEPDRPAAECFAVLPLAMPAMAEALASVDPDAKLLGVAWPSGFVLDGAAFGRARLALPKPRPEPLPHWLVVGLELRLRVAADNDAERDRTGLDVADFDDVLAADVVEAFAQQFLIWVQGWQAEGLASAASAYQARLAEPAGETVHIDPRPFDLVQPGVSGALEGLAERLLLGGAGPALR